MKRITFLFSLILITVTIQVRAQSKMLDVKAFDVLMTSTKDKTILDVRTQEEFSQGHIANATLIDYYKSDFKQQLNKLDKNKPVFVYCKAGPRSESAVGILADLGFKQVYQLQGGYIAWTKARKAVSK